MKSLAHRTSAVDFLLRFCVYNAVLLSVAGIAHAQTAPDFTIIALPDTQYYSESYPNILNTQMQWITANASAMNIQAVLGLGDIVNDGSSATEWANADAAYKLLDAAHIPYFAAIGNHDYDGNNPPGRTSATKNFNNYFGPSRYRNSFWSSPYWISSFPAGSNENFYGVLNINSQPYLIVALEFYPRDSILSWAAQVIQSNADKQVIIITHAYEYFDNTRISPCNSFDAQYYGLGADNDGDAMWAKLVRQYSNITMVLSGHEVRGAGQDAAGRRSDLGVNGNLVNQILSNYQNMTNGGNGYLRIMTFQSSTDSIAVTTYSPYLNAYLTDSNNQFTIPWHQWTGTGNGSISGEVKDISSCVALAAAVSSSTGSTVANASGAYSFPALSPNTYSLTAKYSTYTPASKIVAVGPGMAASGKIYLGTASGQINGLVKDATGNAISGAAVQLTGSASAGGSDETITTGSTGSYASGAIPAATYQVTASAAGYNASTATVSLGSGATLTQNFALNASGSPAPSPTPKISGTGTVTGQVLKDDTTIPLVGAKVAYSGANTTTNSSGAYTLSNLPAGSALTISASQTGYNNASKSVTVSPGATSKVSFALTPTCIASTTNPSVTVCEPITNTAVLNPVHIIAMTNDSHTVTYTQIWVDGVKNYQVAAKSVDTHLLMTTGVSHRLTVQALDDAGQIFKTTVYVTVH
jgi:hypothetical protein